MGTVTAPPSSASGSASDSCMRSMTWSKLSTSTLIGLRAASAAPVSSLPALARPEKSPSRARRNFAPADAARGARLMLPKLTS